MAVTEGNQFEERDFRRGVWHQTATTVALVTTRDSEREDVMACEWAMLVSMNPMRFVISVGPRHATHDLIERTGVFGLSFCSEGQAALSHVSGSYSLNDTDKWTLASFPTYPAKTIDVPMIEGSALNVECHVIATNPLGDHTVFIGEVQWARWDADLRPLLYSAGRYWKIGDQIPKEPIARE